MNQPIVMKKTLFFVALTLCFSCKKEPSATLKVGTWRGELQVNNQETLPFNFEVTSANSLKLFNADEVIFVDDITYKNDSVLIKMPNYDSHYLSAKLSDGALSGIFTEVNRGILMPFKAEYGIKDRFTIDKASAHNVSGKWEAIFNEGISEDEHIDMGIFEQKGSIVTGTFRTLTGDYRYLEGVLNGDQLKLSAFDGSHVYLITATVTDSTMEGIRYLGNYAQEPFKAKRNEAFELADPETLTLLKEGYDTLEFSFPDTSGQMVSLSDERFKDKVVVVQLMGSWCSNCLDETKYYTEYYKNHQDEDLEFVALAFEFAKTKEKAFKSMERLKTSVGIEYPVLLAQFGTVNKEEAQKKLPMLKSVVSYPTTIFIDKKGKVRKTHTGFNGPATGDKYITFKTEFEGFVEMLLKE